MSDLGLALWNTPISKVTMTKEDLRKFLLEHRGKILVNGRLRAIKSQHIGAGIYEIRTEAISYEDTANKDSKVNSDVACLERAIGEIRTTLNGLCARMQTLEENQEGD